MSGKTILPVTPSIAQKPIIRLLLTINLRIMYFAAMCKAVNIEVKAYSTSAGVRLTPYALNKT